MTRPSVWLLFTGQQGTVLVPASELRYTTVKIYGTHLVRCSPSAGFELSDQHTGHACTLEGCVAQGAQDDGNNEMSCRD